MCRALRIVTALAALTMWHVINADEICPCPRVLGRVCGSDHKTYSNLCLLICAQEKVSGLHVVHWGDCQESPPVLNLVVVPPPFCALEYEPLCATDNLTYLNMCALTIAATKRNGLRSIHLGACHQE